MISIEGSRVGYLVKPSLRPIKLGDRKSSVERARNNLDLFTSILLPWRRKRLVEVERKKRQYIFTRLTTPFGAA